MPVPSIPRELIDSIVSHLDGDKSALLSCAATSHTWNASSRYILFNQVVVDDGVPEKGLLDFHHFVPTSDDLSLRLRALHLRGRTSSTWKDVSFLDIRLVASVLFYLTQLQELAIENVRIEGSLQAVEAESRKILNHHPYRLLKFTFGAMVVAENQFRLSLLEFLSMFSEVDQLIIDPDSRYTSLLQDYLSNRRNSLPDNDNCGMARPISRTTPALPEYVPKLRTIMVQKYAGLSSLRTILDAIERDSAKRYNPPASPGIGFAQAYYPTTESEAQNFYPLLNSVASSLVHFEVDLGMSVFQDIEGVLPKLAVLQHLAIKNVIRSDSSEITPRLPPPWIRILLFLNGLTDKTRAGLQSLRITLWVPDTEIDFLQLEHVQWARLANTLEGLISLRNPVGIILQMAYQPFLVAGIPIAVKGVRSWEELKARIEEAKGIIMDGLSVLPITFTTESVTRQH